MRMIKAQLITRVRDENVVLGWLEYVQRQRESEVVEQEQHRVRGECVKRRMRRWIWSMWLGRETREHMKDQRKKRLQRPQGIMHVWASAERGITDRILHSMRCVVQYNRWIHRRRQRALAEEAKRAERKAWCKWFVCGAVVRRHKEMCQEALLTARMEQRGELICSRTRNVGRLGPTKGVVYDETSRRGTRLKETEIGEACTVQRWPHRDKCGPTLAQILHRVWEVT